MANAINTYWSIIFNKKLCSWFIVVIDFVCCHCPRRKKYSCVRMINSVFTAPQLFSLLLLCIEWNNSPLHSLAVLLALFDISPSRRTFCHTLYFITRRLCDRKIWQCVSQCNMTHKGVKPINNRPRNQNINRKRQMYDWWFRVHANIAYKDAKCNNNVNAVAVTTRNATPI